MIDPSRRTAPREERSDTRDEQPGSDLWPRRDLLVLLGITILGTALRLFRIEQWSLSAVEASAWRAVTTHGDGGSSAGEAGGRLVFVALRWLFDAGLLPTPREDWLRLPFAFVGILAVPLAALAAGRLAARATALLTAALLAIHPWHIAVSQTATTPGLALFFAMAAVAAAPRAAATVSWSRWLGPACCLAIAVACDRCGWLAVLAFVVLVSGRSWPRAPRTARWLLAAGCTLLLLGSVWWNASGPAVDAESGAAWLGALGLRVRLPVGLAALAGLLCLPSWPLAVAIGLPVCGLAAVALAGTPVDLDALVLVLPALLWLSASAGERCFALARGHSGGTPLGASVTGLLVWLGIAGSLATDAFLYLTEEQGQRAPWRAAAQQTLGGAGERTGLLVGAGVGADILTCYLRPGHWGERGRDPHPGRAVQPLDRERLSAAVGEFGAATAAGRVMLVLRQDELGQLRSKAPDPLRSFELVSVLPCPLERRDETLYVFRRVAE